MTESAWLWLIISGLTGLVTFLGLDTWEQRKSLAEKRAELADLQRVDDNLRDRNINLSQHNAERRQRNEQLEQENLELRLELQECRRALTSRPGPATPADLTRTRTIDLSPAGACHDVV